MIKNILIINNIQPSKNKFSKEYVSLNYTLIWNVFWNLKTIVL